MIFMFILNLESETIYSSMCELDVPVLGLFNGIQLLLAKSNISMGAK